MLCVWLPEFPIQRLHREQTKPKGMALSHSSESGEFGNKNKWQCVLYTESGNKVTVVTASTAAQQMGVHAGISLSEAQALTESAEFLPHDPDADQQELERLTEVCQHYSPVVGLEQSGQTHCLLLDISGCSHLFGGEARLAEQLVIDLSEQNYFPHVAVAGSVGAAWAIARFGHTTGPDRRLRSLPIEALRLPNDMISQLKEFDLHTVGQLTALPKESLPSRFGITLTNRLNQLYGQKDELLDPVHPPEPLVADWVTDNPVCHPDAIQHICTDLLTEVLTILTSRRQGLLKLLFTFAGETTESVLMEISLTHPASSLSHLLNLLQLKLETTAIPEWVQGIELEVCAVARIQPHQQTLFKLSEKKNLPSSDSSLSKQSHRKKTQDPLITALTDRLTARLGADTVVQPQLLPEAVPEQAVDYLPLTDHTSNVPDEHSRPICKASARPLSLLPQPEPVQVTWDSSGAVQNLQRYGRHYRIITSTKPERIIAGWWQASGAVVRDYFQVETQTGSRFWIFRDQHDQWFLHGIFE